MASEFLLSGSLDWPDFLHQQVALILRELKDFGSKSRSSCRLLCSFLSLGFSSELGFQLHGTCLAWVDLYVEAMVS